jgi:peptide/nickel transport system substrate-binding protein
LADKRVRQALNYAIDKDKIIKGLYAGAAKPLNGPYIVYNEGYDATRPPYPYDPDKAKQLLGDAGYPNGFSITLDTPNGRYLNDKQVAEAAAGDLAKIGVNVSVNPLEWGAVVKLLQEKTSDAILLGQASQDSYQLTSVCFASTIKGLPWLGYVNPEADRLIDQGGQEMDDKARVDDFTRLGALLYDDAPWVFLQAPDDLYGVGPRVQGWQPKGDQVVYINGTTVTG